MALLRARLSWLLTASCGIVVWAGLRYACASLANRPVWLLLMARFTRRVSRVSVLYLRGRKVSGRADELSLRVCIERSTEGFTQYRSSVSRRSAHVGGRQR